jgi:hypothetical protein
MVAVSSWGRLSKSAAVFLLSLLLLLLGMNWSLEVYDEGIILTGAMRVNAGEMIHRDFYANYGPAEFYIISWLFDLFGQRVMVERLFDLLIRAGILCLVYTALSRFCRPSIVIFIYGICGLWLYSTGNHGYPIYPALLLAGISSLLMVDILKGARSIYYPLCAGTLIGLSALFRYDLGFFAFVAHLLSILLFVLSHKHRPENYKTLLREKLPGYVLTTALPVLLVLIWYWQNDALSAFIHDIISFPSQNYASTRGLPFPQFLIPAAGAVYAPPLILALVLYGLFSKNMASANPTVQHQPEDYRLFLLVFAPLTAVFYIKGLVRVSVEHMQLALIPALMLCAVLMEVSAQRPKWLRLSLITLAAISGLSALTCSLEKVMRSNHAIMTDFTGFPRYLHSLYGISAANNFQRDTTADQRNTNLDLFVKPDRAAALRYIVQHTAPSDRLFVGLSQHDIIFINDVSSYFLSQRLPATKWHHFDPGLQNSVAIQREMIKELEQYQPPYVWLESSWLNKKEPNDSAKSSGVFLLDDYIHQHYLLSQQFGQISILQRLPAQPPI